MDDNTHTNGPIMNGDDELAKTLNGGLKFEETPPVVTDDQQQPQGDNMGAGDDNSQTGDDQAQPSEYTPPTMDDMGGDSAASDDQGNHDDVPMIAPAQEDEAPAEEPQSAPVHGSSDLDDLKNSALDDLKPLVGKLNLAPEEKFDTLLLIIRSTDDQSLLAEAHAAAKEISDDSKRAQALLDIIKEVDYFNSKK